MKSAGRQIMFPISVQMHYIYTQMIKTLHMKKFNLSLIAVLFALCAGTMALDAPAPGKDRTDRHTDPVDRMALNCRHPRHQSGIPSTV